MRLARILTQFSVSGLKVQNCSASSACVCRRGFASGVGQNQDVDQCEKDPGKYFFSPEIHGLLKKVTGYDENKIFSRQPRKANTKAPKYEFMVKADYDKLMAEFRKKGERLLQMPPVVKGREDINEVLSEDPEIKGYDLAKYVFTDISYGISDRKRLIVVREPDGTLRKARWEERDRLNSVYFTVPRKLHRIPEMFESPEKLDKALERKDYLFVLNRACLQFEPDHPTYQWVVARTYEHIDAQRAHDDLRSTRHYGPMVFHLAWTRSIDNLVVDLIDTKRLSDAADVVRIFYLMHPEAAASQDLYPEKPLEYLKQYGEKNSSKKGVLDLAIQHYESMAKSDAVGTVSATA